MPKISLLVPMYNTKEKYLKELIESVKRQTYSNWELVLADGSQEENENYKKYFENERIKYKFLNKNLGISGNSNEAIKLASGDYLGLLDHDDTLSEYALFFVVEAINKNPNAEFFYSDEDKMDEVEKK